MEDNLLWKAIALIGITSGKRVSKKLKCISWIGVIIMCFSALKSVIISLLYGYICSRELLSDGRKVFLAFLFFYFIIILSWYSLFRKINHLQILLAHASRYEYVLNILPKRGIPAINVLIVFNCVVLLLLITLNVIFLSMYPSDEDCVWNSGLGITDPVILKFLLTINSFSTYLYCSYTPILITLVVCHVEYRFYRILIAFNQRLENLPMIEDKKEYICLFASYFQIVEILRKLKSSLSPILFTLLLCNFVGVFTFLSSALMFPMMSFTSRLLTCVNGFEGCCMILAQVLYGSLIPGRLKDIQITSGRLIEKHRLYLPSHSKLLFFLKRIERKEIIYMTAGGLINVERNLLLAIWGSLLTYGLLLINLK